MIADIQFIGYVTCRDSRGGKMNVKQFDEGQYRDSPHQGLVTGQQERDPENNAEDGG